MHVLYDAIATWTVAVKLPRRHQCAQAASPLRSTKLTQRLGGWFLSAVLELADVRVAQTRCLREILALHSQVRPLNHDGPPQGGTSSTAGRIIR